MNSLPSTVRLVARVGRLLHYKVELQCCRLVAFNHRPVICAPYFTSAQFLGGNPSALVKPVCCQRSYCQSVASNTQSKGKYGDEVYELKQIYSGSLCTSIKALRVFSITTSVGALVIQKVIYDLASNSSFGLMMFIGVTYFLFTVGSPALIYLVTKNYVHKMYYCKENDTYTLVLQDFFFQYKEIDFKIEDIDHDITRLLVSFLVKKRPVIVESFGFSDDHYVRLMKYDQPIDFKIDKQILDKKTEQTPISKN